MSERNTRGHCPDCGSILDDDGTCPSCRPEQRIVSPTTTTGSAASETPVVTTGSTLSPFDIMSTIGTITMPPPDASKFRFKFRGKFFEIENLDKEMNTLFRDFHIEHYGGASCDLDKLKKQSEAYFDANRGRQNHLAHDRFFQNFYIIWNDYLERQLYDKAEEIWEFALNIAHSWEDSNPDIEIHKGTPYYFWAVTRMLNNRLDEAFLLMHQALDEDKRTHAVETPSTPAYAFVTLDPTQRNQFFREKVVEISSFVSTLLDNYNSTRGGHLTFPQLQQRFLRRSDVQEAVFYFVYTAFRLRKLLNEIYSPMKHNVFSSLLEANTLFDLCLVVDVFIRSKYASPPPQATFGMHLNFLSTAREHGLPTPLSFTGRVRELRSAFTSNFASTLQTLLDSSFRFQGGTNPPQIDKDFAISYGVRNFGGHRIENQPIIYNNLKALSQRIVNALFFLVENCA